MEEAVFDIEKLREVALDQHGFVTVGQALEVGVSRSSLSHLVARGRLERPCHGVYRVPQVARTRLDPFALAVLWTGSEEAVLSHETALDLYDTCDVNPGLIHVTVPRGVRIRRGGGDDYVLHHEDLDAGEVGWLEELPVVTCATAIRQCIDSGTPTYLLLQALERARLPLLSDRDRDMLTERLETRNGER